MDPNKNPNIRAAKNSDAKENFDDNQSKSSSKRFVLEFRVSQISGSFDIDTIASAIENDLNTAPKNDRLISIDFNQITGVVKYPERWTQKILIYLDNENSKDDLLIRGLTLYGQHIELSELGLGPIKVMVQNADLFFPDSVIRDWLSQFGEITGFKHETHKLKHSKWYTGNRVVWMKNVGRSIPPAAKLSSGEDVANISVWHYGQTEIKCRFCHSVVPKGHACKRAPPPRKCFTCGETDHVKADCPKNSYGTQFPSLVAPIAAPGHPNAGKTPLKVIDPSKPLIRRSPIESPNENTQAKRQRRSSSPTLSFYGDESGSDVAMATLPTDGTASGQTSLQNMSRDQGQENNEESEESPRGRSKVKGTCEVAFFTDNNCKEMELTGDDILHLNTTMLSDKKGLKIQMAGGMLENMSHERKNDLNVAVLHVGAKNFPTKTEQDFEDMCQVYQTFVEEVIKECPKASIVISSVPPRAGDDPYKEAINSCIGKFNQKICSFNELNDIYKSRLHYLDNDVHLKDSDMKVITGLYIDPDGEGDELNDEGHNRVKSGMIDAIKSVFYQDKLVDAQSFSVGGTHSNF